MGAGGRGRLGAGRLVGAALALCVGAGEAGEPPADATGAAGTEDRPTAEADGDTNVDAATQRGREAYKRGQSLAREEQWGDALAAFEEAARARDAPLVQSAIAYCLRALGRYVAAREVTRRVLADPAGLAPSQIEDANGYMREFDALLVRLEVTLEPPTAMLTVDGRPLQPAPADDANTFLAGVAPPGEGKALGKRRLVVVLDPGSHLIRAVRPGHQPALVQRAYRPGDRAKLDLRLDALPATVAVKSDPPQAIVRVDGREVGLAPAEFQRPAGRYEVEVELDGYDSYVASLDLHAGQRADLTAPLVPYEQPIYEAWWFWTTAAAVVAGGVVLTYFLTRPEEEPPPYDGGSTGWVVQPQAIRF